MVETYGTLTVYKGHCGSERELWVMETLKVITTYRTKDALRTNQS